MKKFRYLFLLVLSVVMLSSCAGNQQMNDVFKLEENWIDDKDLQTILEKKDASKWLSVTGSPVIMETRKDTILYFYNYKPALYQTTKNGKEIKPKEANRTKYWGSRKEMITIKVVDNLAVAIHKLEEYDKVNDQTVQIKAKPVEQQGKWMFWVVGGVVGAFLIAVL